MKIQHILFATMIATTICVSACRSPNVLHRGSSHPGMYSESAGLITSQVREKAKSQTSSPPAKTVQRQAFQSVNVSNRVENASESQAEVQQNPIEQVVFTQDDNTIAPAQVPQRDASLPYLDSAQPNEATITYESANTTALNNDGNRYPIDFPTVLSLAGADNWNVKIASERVAAANAAYSAAKAEWLPSLNFGLGYNHHEGEIQATEGDVISVSRGSLFVGGGAGVANAPLTGASGGPARMFVDFSLADAIFKPLAACQLVKAEQARNSRVFNDTMLESSIAYFDLVGAQSRLAIASENLAEAERLLQLVAAFVDAGKGTLADNRRMQVIGNSRRQDVAKSRAEIGIASANLARTLQLDSQKLDPELGLFATDVQAIPIQLIDQSSPASELVRQALCVRGEIAEADARAQAALVAQKTEYVRPLLPNIHVGYSGGVFGGGQGSDLDKLDGRSDFDLLVNWQLRNLGAGNGAARRLTRSELNQSIYAGRQVKDQIANEVEIAYLQVQMLSETIPLAEASIQEAADALAKNIEAIRGLEGMPLEAVQSLNDLTNARVEYLNTIIDYNQWQLRLMRAVGEPIGHSCVSQ